MVEIAQKESDPKLSPVIKNEATPYIPVSDDIKTVGKENDLVDDPGDLYDKESKEKMEKSLEFEESTFKINSIWWKEEKRNVDQWNPMKVKVNATGDVIEYLEWPAKWEQIFISYDAFIREVCKAKSCTQNVAEK